MLHAYLTSIKDYAMNVWRSKGVPANKLVMGIPFYGRSFVLNDAANYLPGNTATSKKEGFSGPYTQENGFLAYFEICTMAKEGSWITSQDDDGNVYMRNGNKWVGFDTPGAVERKVRYCINTGTHNKY